MPAPIIKILTMIRSVFIGHRSLTTLTKTPQQNQAKEKKSKSLSLLAKIKQAFLGFKPTLTTKQKIAKIIQDQLEETGWKQISASQHKSSLTATSKIKVENFFVTQEGVLVFFHLLKAQTQEIKVYAQLLETARPEHVLWQRPKLITKIGVTAENWQFDSLIKLDQQYLAVWRSPTLGTKEVTYPRYFIENEIELKHEPMTLFKPEHNPLIKPNQDNSWESFCTFNPAAVYAADKIHLLYRAQNHNYLSQLGYACSQDGLSIDKKLSQPAYRPSQKFEGVTMPLGNPQGQFVSGGGCGGVEDPRATIIDQRVYVTYVAYDGWNPPRIALTSIALNDFLNHQFFWEKPVLISPPNIVDKSAVIFPEKVNGQYVIMHRIFPNILIDYVDHLNFDGHTYLKGEHKITPRSREWWDSRKVGAGAPPLKTDQGWLLIYQATDDKDDSEYKVGAMLLDLEDPTKVLYRSQKPILEPRKKYENNGFKAGVVYPCGAVIKNETLFVYYGGADSYVCVATAPLQEFLQNLKNTGLTHLKPTHFGKA